ncbi:hypothetical protein B0H14DRAFT_2615706 [Mycena olivaceomarginata]|nr:hypothetical protein B0H14DRAFT_2615706 [Mycena olivaceomarginata]
MLKRAIDYTDGKEKRMKEREGKRTDIPLSSVEFKDNTHTRYSRCGGAARSKSHPRRDAYSHLCRTGASGVLRAQIGPGDVDAERERRVEIDTGRGGGAGGGGTALGWQETEGGREAEWGKGDDAAARRDVRGGADAGGDAKAGDADAELLGRERYGRAAEQTRPRPRCLLIRARELNGRGLAVGASRKSANDQKRGDLGRLFGFVGWEKVGGNVGNWGGRGRKPSFDAIMGQLVGKAWETVKALSRINGFGTTIFIVGIDEGSISYQDTWAKILLRGL